MLSSFSPSPKQPELVVEAHVPGRYVAGSVRNVIVFCWLGDGTLEGVQLLDALCEKLTGGRTRAASALHIIREGVALPDAPVRSALISSMKRYAPVTSCIAIAMQGAGFWASALQSALTGIRMVAPVGDSVMRFGKSPESLVDWLVTEHAGRTGEALTGPQLLSAVEQLLRLASRAAQPTP